MNTNIKIMFWLRRNREAKSLVSPVYCRLSYAGKRVEISTGVNVPTFKWKNGLVKGNGVVEKAQNSMLKNMMAKLILISNSMDKSDTSFSLIDVKKNIWV
ncbi:hypothetical protein FUAX_50970 (plasmid) [Fulvitalea axinellae]|uniref:Arm DNA-binding domain-containing protein n=1 Tax=Fulvitalea axinellae TaxID=1182444 RepID=A0AAU9CU10_9BACT|nr:hypothetical protein FUAX_50970 [Fulvitalea axinellae]